MKSLVLKKSTYFHKPVDIKYICYVFVRNEVLVFTIYNNILKILSDFQI